MTDCTWILMPWRNNPAMTLQAVEDCLAQSVPTRVLLINQGASKADRAAVDLAIEQREDHRVLGWNYLPALPSLSACWNRALRFVWELGGEEALVVNNDVRLHRETLQWLSVSLEKASALFVSAVGVKDGQFAAEAKYEGIDFDSMYARGGPDFSCFLLSRAGHEKYPFDETFIPAYCEDLDQHRRYMLCGDGQRIFSVNLPFLHYASGTIKAYTPEERAAFNKGYAGVVARYTHLWGGGPNQETFCVKGDPSSARTVEEVSTPVLQRRVQAGEDVQDVGPDHAEDAGDA